MRHAQLAREAILENAWQIASHEGLPRLTPELLAAKLGVSEIDVFVHIGSVEALQLAVLDRYTKELEMTVFGPARGAGTGLDRLRTFFRCAVQHILACPAAGCLYVSGLFKYADRPGPLRTELIRRSLEFREAMSHYVRESVEQGDLSPDTPHEHVAAEMYGLLLLLQSETRLLGSSCAVSRIEFAFQSLLKRYGYRPSVPGCTMGIRIASTRASSTYLSMGLGSDSSR